MSIRANPRKGVTALLSRLKGTMISHQHVSPAEDIMRINEFIDRFIKITADNVKQYDEKLLDHFLELDRHHRKIKGADFRSILEDLTQIDELIRNRTDQSQDENCFKALSPLERRIIENADNPIVKCLRVSYDLLDGEARKICLLHLAIFPENAVLKKRLLIYWWIGEGWAKNESEGEQIFGDLLNHGLIILHRTDNLPSVKKCQIHPWIRYMLITEARKLELLYLDEHGLPCFDPAKSGITFLIDGGKSVPETRTVTTIFNGSQKNLDHDHQWLTNYKNLAVLQLGRWQAAPTHHVEVVNESLPKGLGPQKHLRYLSLRGISRIFELPSSIVELINLEILDLHACHNLEKLPDDIASLKKLTHLDVSKCYLLESMPKGIDKLTSLQVLKGFIISNPLKTPCRIQDLRSLRKLERLAIHIGSEGVFQNKGFERLKDLKNVRCLKISWGLVGKDPLPAEHFSFPPLLEKLDLEGIPYEWLPDFKPSLLRQLKKLYIKGGKLGSLYHDEEEQWKVEILLIKYTKNLRINLNRIRQMFPSLKYVKKVGRKANREVDMAETSGEESDCEWPCKGSLE